MKIKVSYFERFFCEKFKTNVLKDFTKLENFNIEIMLKVQ